MMLQQTRVETVLRHYEPWLRRFPTIESLAAASEQDVAAQWSGLGYYRRARFLHAAARQVARGGWPRDLRDLPGVGPYVAAALGSIAFGRDEAAVDGNVVRVMSRWFDIDADTTTAAGKHAIEAAARASLQEPAGDWNQALMDLGAMICTPQPDCNACPVRADCLARERGTQRLRPVRPAKRQPVVEAVHFAYMERDGAVLLVERPEGLLAGTWCLPGGSVETPLSTWCQKQIGAPCNVQPQSVQLQHRFTHRTWHMAVHRADVEDAPAGTWVPLDALDSIGLSTAARNAIKRVNADTASH